MPVRPAAIDDAAAIAEIYNHYILTSHATFELDTIDPGEMARRMVEGVAAGYPFLVCEHDRLIEGYAYGRQFRPRAAYRRSIEVSIYIRPGSERRGHGVALYESLIPQIVDLGFHTIIAGISLPNEASIALHERFGFEKTAHFREVGRKFDRWIDVAYWQLMAGGRGSERRPVK